MLHDSAHGIRIITYLPEVNTLFSVFLEKDTRQKIVHIHLKVILVQYKIYKDKAYRCKITFDYFNCVLTTLEIQHLSIFDCSSCND